MENNKVKSFFDNPKNYSTNSLNVMLRKTIVANILGSIENKSILDIGCGNGALSLNYLDNNKITFLDLSENMLNMVKKSIPETKLKNVVFINADFQEFNFSENYDIILCIGVLAHVKDIEKFILKIMSVLKQNGKIIIQITDDSQFLSKTIRLLKKTKNVIFKRGGIYPYQINYITRIQLTKTLVNLKLTIKQKNYFWRPNLLISYIPLSIQERLINFINKQKYLSQLGTELFIQVEKNGN